MIGVVSSCLQSAFAILKLEYLGISDSSALLVSLQLLCCAIKERTFEPPSLNYLNDRMTQMTRMTHMTQIDR